MNVKPGDAVIVKSGYIGGKAFETVVIRVSAKTGIVTVKYMNMRFRSDGTPINASKTYPPRLVMKEQTQ